MTNQQLINREIKKELLSKFNPCHYDSLETHSYIDTCFGEFWLESKPNIYQPIDERFWVFYQCTDSEGEPISDGQIITIKL